MTSKQRALEYIREKNFYRKGGPAKSYFKISEGMIDNEVFFYNTIDRMEADELKKLKKRWKLTFQTVDIQGDLQNDDFTNDLITVLFTFKLTFTPPYK